jgi:hypothetical protein
MSPYDPQKFTAAEGKEAFSFVSRVGLDVEVMERWDIDLLREPRVCVPIDVQALVVPAGDAAGSEGVRLVGPLSPGRDAAGAAAHERLAGPEPFAAAQPRDPGVHLHWAMPDALLAGTLADPTATAPAPAGGPGTAGGGLGLPALPDHWLVLRLMAPANGTAIAHRGWVLDAGTGRVWPLGAWTGDPAGPGAIELPDTAAVPPDGLTGTAGGTLTWTAGYDAAASRFAVHDPLDDLAADAQLGGMLPGGPAGERATYVVVGWWSRPDLDPLDEIRSGRALTRRLDELGWRLEPSPHAVEPPSGSRTVAAQQASTAIGTFAAEELGLERKQRFGDADVVDVTPGLLEFIDGPLTFVKPPRPPRPEASTLLHGTVVGVPVAGDVAGRVRAAELRPASGAAEAGLGESIFDALGAMTARRAAARLGVDGGDQLAVVERLITAFTQHALQELSSPSGAAEIDADMHALGFETVEADEPGVGERLVVRKGAIPGRGRRIGSVPTGAGKHAKKLVMASGATKGLAIAKLVEHADVTTTVAASAGTPSGQGATDPAAVAKPAVRTERRPAPPRYVPSDPYLAVRGAGRSLRHGGDGRWSSDGKLLVRTPSQLVGEFRGVLRGADVMAALPTGAVPPEATALAREAVLVTPHLSSWLAGIAADRADGGRGGGRGIREAYEARISAEHLLRYDVSGAYSTKAATRAVSEPVVDAVWRAGDPDPDAIRLISAIREHSVLTGVEPSPVGVTAWAQPWSPMWLEFSVDVHSTGASAATTSAWTLGQTDVEPGEGTDPADAPRVLTVTSRVPLTTGPATALGAAVARYVDDETQRDVKGVGEIDDALSDRLAELAGVAGSPDLLGARLDGVRNRLLGLPARSVSAKAPDGTPVPIAPDALPHLLAAGMIRLAAARVLDAFGRVLDLDPQTAAVPQRLRVARLGAALQRAPRFTAPARVRLRLVGADAVATDDAVDALVDEAEPEKMVNPVAGFLLPDHVDESLEVFATDGTPIGELLATGARGPDGGGVVWEPAPGRPVPVDAPPQAGLEAPQACLAALAAGIVGADALARGGGRAVEGADSALSALLRTVDTTLWNVDPVAGAGSAELAAIVGRPIAVVRAVLEVDVAEDLDALALDDAARAERAAAYADLAQVGVRVRLGELTRPDDGLLAWFADDDFSRARLVDAAVADLAREAGRARGHLGDWGATPVQPDVDPIRHPYLVAEDEIVVRPGVPRLITLLMAPGAAVHFTSGVVPRGRVALSRSWFAAGLDRLVPSIRVGPVLIDPGDVRLPLVAALGEEQTLTTREGPIGWRDDAILAATASAVLPDRATVLREGWIRVTPGEPQAPS